MAHLGSGEQAFDFRIFDRSKGKVIWLIFAIRHQCPAHQVWSGKYLSAEGVFVIFKRSASGFQAGIIAWNERDD